MKKIFRTNSREETWKIAGEILKNLEASVILLEGELGVGKTTFAQGILKVLGAEGPFTSPTFVIMKRYALGRIELPESDSNYPNDFKFLYHFDCYRVGPEDIVELGWEEIIKNSKNLVLVEWPEKIKRIWPKKYLHLKFEIIGENERKILVEKK